MNNKLDFNNSYLTDQIITYLGNKRKLLGFINETVDNIVFNDVELSKKDFAQITFFDIFAGSGVVSRYARLKGFQTLSNDLEIYSKIINEALLVFTDVDYQNIFKEVRQNLSKDYSISSTEDAYADVIHFLNQQEAPLDKKDNYFSIHYAPKDTSNPDFDHERLFYTQENANKIDSIVAFIFNKIFFTEEAKKSSLLL